MAAARLNPYWLDNGSAAADIGGVQTPFSTATSSGTRSPSDRAQPERIRLRLPPPFGGLTLEMHRSLASAELDWRAFESQAHGYPYQRFHWLSAWNTRIRTSDEQPFVVVLRDRTGIRMLLPLALERRFGVSRLVPMGTPVCDYHGPLIDPKFAQALTPEVAHGVLMAVAALTDADYVLLTRIPPMLGAVHNPFSELCLQRFSADAHGIALSTEWEAFYAELRSAKTRSRLRAKEKALARFGPIAFTEVSDSQERADLVTEMMALKASQLKATAGAFNTFARTDVQGFFQALAGEADRSEVLFFKLTVGGTLVAAALGVVRHGCFYYEVPVYGDQALQRFSPGGLLLIRLMQWAINRGCTRFDFTIGDEPYKAEWCDERWPLACGAWSRTLRGRAAAKLALAEIAVARQIKKRPWLYTLVARIRTGAGRVRQSLRAEHG